MLIKKSAVKQAKPGPVADRFEEAAVISNCEQIQPDYKSLTRSHRNPDFDVKPPFDAVSKKPELPLPTRVTGWAAAVTGGVFLCYGLAGLVNYYGKDWQDLISAPFLEPVSKTAIFSNTGFSRR